MFHLMPIKLLLSGFAGVILLTVAVLYQLGIISSSNRFEDWLLTLKYATPSVVAYIFVLYAVWRWVPRVQKFIFPYLGGSWLGYVKFDNQGKSDSRPVELIAKHTILGIKLLLDSKETRSHTLVVYPQKDQDFGLHKLYYIYLNERKEGVPGAGERYRGVAIVRYDDSGPPSLEGDYFTDTHRKGTLHLKLVEPTSWWKLW